MAALYHGTIGIPTHCITQHALAALTQIATSQNRSARSTCNYIRRGVNKIDSERTRHDTVIHVREIRDELRIA
eukprot:6174036-Pleurochrysis_carterae.AAC.2